MTQSVRQPAPPAPALQPAGLLVRLASMTYDAVLLFGVVFIASYLLLTLTRWSYPLSGIRRAVFQTAVFVVIGWYFVYQWSKSGQTLAMKSWHLRLVDNTGKPPAPGKAVLRYLLAWYLLLPGLIWGVFAEGRPALTALMLVAGFAALILLGRFDARRRLLHDRLSGTQLTRAR